MTSDKDLPPEEQRRQAKLRQDAKNEKMRQKHSAQRAQQRAAGRNRAGLPLRRKPKEGG